MAEIVKNGRGWLAAIHALRAVLSLEIVRNPPGPSPVRDGSIIRNTRAAIGGAEVLRLSRLNGSLESDREGH